MVSYGAPRSAPYADSTRGHSRSGEPRGSEVELWTATAAAAAAQGGLRAVDALVCNPCADAQAVRTTKKMPGQGPQQASMQASTHAGIAGRRTGGASSVFEERAHVGGSSTQAAVHKQTALRMQQYASSRQSALRMRRCSSPWCSSRLLHPPLTVRRRCACRWHTPRRGARPASRRSQRTRRRP